MKLKLILSAFILSFFAIIGGGSSDDGDDLIVYLILVFVIFAIFMGISTLISNDRKEEIRKKNEAARKAQIKIYNDEYQSFVAKNGKPDKTIVITPYEIKGAVYVYEAKKSIFLRGKRYDFKDIMSCKYIDDPTTVKGKITAVSKSNTGNVIGRSIVGDVVAGPAGAVIGGATGKKETEYVQGADKVYHNYTVIINVNSITNPIVRIETGNDEKVTNELVGLINVIISRK